MIDYKSEDLVKAVRKLYPRGVDKALNGVAGAMADAVARTLRRGGHRVDLTETVTGAPPDVHVKADCAAQANAPKLTELARMFDDGSLQLESQASFPLEKAGEALVLTGHVRGKVVLEIN